MSEDGSTRYYGKYRGTVINNVDPMQQGRLMVQVPDVLTLTPSSWALPCVPVAGKQMGVFVLPAVGSHVWVEFEQGDPSHPIWVGGWWETAAEIPTLALAAPPVMQNIVLQTTGQNTILISDVPGPSGGIMLKTATGAMLMINDTGITISNGKGATIMMTGPMVSINNGALDVT
jgi:uncharacterized protein involved in type VI secretion and phage assembly